MSCSWTVGAVGRLEQCRVVHAVRSGEAVHHTVKLATLDQDDVGAHIVDEMLIVYQSTRRDARRSREDREEIARRSRVI